MCNSRVNIINLRSYINTGGLQSISKLIFSISIKIIFIITNIIIFHPNSLLYSLFLSIIIFMQKPDNSFQQQLLSNCSYCIQHHHTFNFNTALYKIYSSSQDYYYTKQINQIIQQASTPANIIYEDNQFYDQQQQFLRRIYKLSQYNGKMFNINEYYFYHKDYARIFHKQIVLTYMRWQQKKKKILYRKLKKMLNESHQSQKSSVNQSDNQQQNQKNGSHLLNDLSQYNPNSKKYYLDQNQNVNKLISTKSNKQQNSQTLFIIQKNLKSILQKYSYISDISKIQSESNTQSNILLQIQNQTQQINSIPNPKIISPRKITFDLVLPPSINNNHGQIKINDIIKQKTQKNGFAIRYSKQESSKKKLLAPLNTITITNPFKKKNIDIKGIKVGQPNQKIKIQNIPQQPQLFKLEQKISNQKLKPASLSTTNLRIKIKRKSQFITPTKDIITSQRKNPFSDFRTRKVDEFSDKKIIGQGEQIRTHRSQNIEIKTRSATNFRKITPSFLGRTINLFTIDRQSSLKKVKKSNENNKYLKNIEQEKMKQILGLRLQIK